MSNVPPSPKTKFWGMDHGFRFQREPLSYLMEIAEFPSDMVLLQMGPYNYYILKHPDLIHEALVKRASSLHRSNRQKQVFGKFIGNGLANSDGEYWKQQRKLIQPAFHVNRIRNYADTMVRIVEDSIRAWQEGQKLNLADEMKQITMKIVTTTLFGTEIHDQTKRVSEIIDLIQDKTMREFSAFFLLPDSLPLPYKVRERHAIAELNMIVMDIIAGRRAEGQDTGDLLSMLLFSTDEDGNSMSDVQARDEAMTLFIAGHETTAVALTWTWYLLTQYPDVLARVLDEIDTVLQGRAAMFDDLPKLTYMDQVFKESLRIFPPTWAFQRQAVEPTTIGGYDIPKGGIVQISPYILHHDARFFPEPQKFNPERFSPENESSIPKFAYFPFGGGPHICIGNHFARMEAILVMATILQRMTFALDQHAGVLELEPLITLRPKGGLPVVVESSQKGQTVPRNEDTALENQTF